MAKVIRHQQVYFQNPYHKPRKLPPYQDNKPFNYEEQRATPENFPHRLKEPPKLWLAWLYRAPSGGKVYKKTQSLFGEDPQPGKMHVFKNTPSTNKLLWQVKHLIEVRPITFPHGEPTQKDVNRMQLLPTGECRIDKLLEAATDELVPAEKYKMERFASGEVLSMTMRKWHQFDRWNEDDVWSDPNRSRL